MIERVGERSLEFTEQNYQKGFVSNSVDESNTATNVNAETTKEGCVCSHVASGQSQASRGRTMGM